MYTNYYMILSSSWERLTHVNFLRCSRNGVSRECYQRQKMYTLHAISPLSFEELQGSLCEGEQQPLRLVGPRFCAMTPGTFAPLSSSVRIFGERGLPSVLPPSQVRDSCFRGL